MKLLLDTHAFLWWDSNDARLPENLRSAIASPRNEVFVSAVTVWEIAIKRGLGKLIFGQPACKAIKECGGPVCSDRFFGFLSGIIVRRNRGGGNVKISFIDFQGLWEGRETVLSFSVLSTDRHFHGRLRCALCRPC
jgi:hypothetical protein